MYYVYSVMAWIVLPHPLPPKKKNSHVEVLTLVPQNVTVFGGRAFKIVIKLKFGQMDML